MARAPTMADTMTHTNSAGDPLPRVAAVAQAPLGVAEAEPEGQGESDPVGVDLEEPDVEGDGDRSHGGVHGRRGRCPRSPARSSVCPRGPVGWPHRAVPPRGTVTEGPQVAAVVRVKGRRWRHGFVGGQGGGGDRRGIGDRSGDGHPSGRGGRIGGGGGPRRGVGRAGGRSELGGSGPAGRRRTIRRVAGHRRRGHPAVRRDRPRPPQRRGDHRRGRHHRGHRRDLPASHRRQRGRRVLRGAGAGPGDGPAGRGAPSWPRPRWPD